MNTEPLDIPTKNKKTLLSGKKLAKLLDVAAPTLSEATKKGYNCAGYPVGEWADISESGRVHGYDVPGFLLLEHQYNHEERSNPEPEETNKANLAPNKGGNVENPQNTAVTNNYSLLPKGEKYAHPVGIASLSMVLKQALGNDTPQTRAVIGGILGLLGAITAHSITDSGVAAGLGAGAGLGIALYFYKNTKNVNTESFITKPLPEQPPAFSENYNRRMLANSGYIVY